MYLRRSNNDVCLWSPANGTILVPVPIYFSTNNDERRGNSEFTCPRERRRLLWGGVICSSMRGICGCDMLQADLFRLACTVAQSYSKHYGTRFRPLVPILAP